MKTYAVFYKRYVIKTKIKLPKKGDVSPVESYVVPTENVGNTRKITKKRVKN